MPPIALVTHITLFTSIWASLCTNMKTSRIVTAIICSSTHMYYALNKPCSNSQCDEVSIWVHDMSTLTLIHTREASQTAATFIRDASQWLITLQLATANEPSNVRACACISSRRAPSRCMCVCQKHYITITTTAAAEILQNNGYVCAHMWYTHLHPLT